jgi:uracil-DNA glycosylase
MNAKERLRAYLEQRRELGESEMVLDALDVDDVMRMLGALQSDAATHALPSATTPPPPVSQRVAPPPPHSQPTPNAPPTPHTERPRAEAQSSDGAPLSDDWNEVMRTLKGDARATPPVAKAPLPTPPSVSEPIGTPSQPAGTLRIEGIVVPLGLRVERPALRSTIGDEWNTLADVTAAITACTGCALVQSATRPVPGVGNPVADVMVIGEAPGEQEDLRGEPFVGPAGELLDKILAAIQLDRTTVYIANVLKHRPPGNRTPLPDEVRACAPFLQRQIDLVRPKLIIALGNSAAHALLGTKLGLGKLRQQLHWYQGIPLVATYHPAALLRNDAWKRPTWEDVKFARRVLDATIRT